MNIINVYFSNASQNPKNRIYEKHQVINLEDYTADRAQTVFCYDYTCSSFVESKRSVDNFIKADCVMFDIDNTHSDEPEKWITPEDVSRFFDGVPMLIHFSRNHNISKNEKAARPKFHVIFPCDEYTSADAYADFKRQIVCTYKWFDQNAIDAARFFFGTDSPNIQVINGNRNLNEWYQDKHRSGNENQLLSARMPLAPISIIPEGQRNNTMYRTALDILRAQSNLSLARTMYNSFSERCVPPLDEEELDTIWNSALKSNRSANIYMPSTDLSYEFKYITESMIPLKGNQWDIIPNEFNESSQVEKLIAIFGKQMLCNDAGDMLLYTGTHWTSDNRKCRVMIQEFAWLQVMHANMLVRFYRGGEDDIYHYGMKLVQDYKAHAVRMGNAKSINSVFELLKDHLHVSQDKLDSNANLICTPCGTYDLTHGMSGFYENRPEDHLLMITSCSPSEKGKDIWEEALKNFFGDNQELIAFMQAYIGGCCYGLAKSRKILIADGSGSNGKSTFFNTIKSVLGGYAGNISADILMNTSSRSSSYQIAELHGKRLIVTGELEKGISMRGDKLKQLASDDPITAEKKYKDPFSFNPTHDIVMYTNHLPKIDIEDEAVKKRIVVVPFYNIIPDDKKIQNYEQVLLQKAGEAIMLWLIEGARIANEWCFRYEQHYPQCVSEATQKCFNESDQLQQFINECFELGSGLHTRSGEFINAYKHYCEINSEKMCYTTHTITEAMLKKGFHKKRSNAG